MGPAGAEYGTHAANKEFGKGFFQKKKLEGRASYRKNNTSSVPR